MRLPRRFVPRSDKKGTTRNDRELGNFSYWQFLYALRAGYIVFPLIIMNLLKTGIIISYDNALSSFCHCETCWKHVVAITYTISHIFSCHCEPTEGRCGNLIHFYPHLCIYLFSLSLLPTSLSLSLYFVFLCQQWIAIHSLQPTKNVFNIIQAEVNKLAKGREMKTWGLIC